MQQINELLDEKMLLAYKSQEKRNYLGASMLGDDCMRKIQLQFIGKDAEISARTLRTFNIGHCFEDLIAHWLRIAGFYLLTKNENGEQFGFSVANGRIAGHVDGIIQGFPKEVENLHTASGWWLWECKTLCNKSWNDTNRRGVLVSKPLYYVQTQLYMAYMKLKRCLFTALNKDTSELYFEVIPFDAEAAQRYSDRAVQILKATENNELMSCISSDSSFYKCKMCEFRNVCRETK